MYTCFSPSDFSVTLFPYKSVALKPYGNVNVFAGGSIIGGAVVAVGVVVVICEVVIWAVVVAVTSGACEVVTVAVGASVIAGVFTIAGALVTAGVSLVTGAFVTAGASAITGASVISGSVVVISGELSGGAFSGSGGLSTAVSLQAVKRIIAIIEIIKKHFINSLHSFLLILTFFRFFCKPFLFGKDT